MSSDIRYPPGFGLKDVVGWGSTGLIVLDAPTQTVIKTPMDDASWSPVQRERCIYERLDELGGHNGIISYYGVEGEGIRLEYASNHDMHSFIQEHNSPNLHLRWMIQLAEALSFIHNAGIVHGDLTTSNMFLDDRLNLKLADFAGSSIDSKPLLVTITASHEYPGNLLSRQGDIFAFGSAMYELIAGERPYSLSEEDEIRKRYQGKEFPDVSHLGSLGQVIRRCWEGGYSDSEALTKDLRAIRDRDAWLRRVSVGLGVIILATLIYKKLARTS